MNPPATGAADEPPVREAIRGRTSWSLWRAVVVVVAVLLVVLAVASVLLIRTSTALRAAQGDATTRLDRAQDDTATLLASYLDEETGLRGYLLDGQALFLQPYNQATTSIPVTERQLGTELHSVTGGPAALDAVESAYQKWVTSYATPQLAAIKAGRLAQAQASAEAQTGKALFDAIRAETNQLRTLIATRQASNQAHITRLQDQLQGLLVGALALIALGLVVTVAVTRTKVIRPLQRLTAAARRVAGGELRTAVTVDGPQEYRSLGHDVDTMRYRLVEEISRARSAAEALLHDGPTVAALSDALAPRTDHLPAIAAVGRLDPAEGVLAGDWYDLIKIDDTLAVIVGDVAGHGPASAVLALRLRAVIATMLTNGVSPGDALAAAATHIADDTPELFATVFVAVLDPASRLIRYASAGHPAALLKQAGAQPPTRKELAPTGPLISPIVALWSWRTVTEPYPPGDGLLVYTDGITEGRNANSEQYGIERLHRDLATETAGLPAEVVTLIATNVDHFVGGSQTDDRTLVYCQHLHPDPISPPPAN